MINVAINYSIISPYTGLFTFLALYAVNNYSFPTVFFWDTSESPRLVFFFQSDYVLELKLISLGACGVLHVLCALFCVWSVEWKTMCMCSTLKEARTAVLAKVVPTKNNGSTQLCIINRHKVRVGCRSTSTLQWRVWSSTMQSSIRRRLVLWLHK